MLPDRRIGQSACRPELRAPGHKVAPALETGYSGMPGYQRPAFDSAPAIAGMVEIAIDSSVIRPCGDAIEFCRPYRLSPRLHNCAKTDLAIRFRRVILYTL